MGWRDQRMIRMVAMSASTIFETIMLRPSNMHGRLFWLEHFGCILMMAAGTNLTRAESRPFSAAGLHSSPKLEEQPFTIEEVHFHNGNDLLAGSLFLPKVHGRYPAVVLVLGSGAQDRTYGGTATVLAKHFACHGFACLTWDKPGVGKSTGDYTQQTFRHRAEEAIAAVRFLRGRSDIHRDRVGIWGHSQGGMVAPLIASMDKEVAFVIEVSGWQGPAWQQDAVRVEAELRADGFLETDVRAAVTFARKRMSLIRGTAAFEELDRSQEAVKRLPWFPYVHRCDRATFYGARRCVDEDISPNWEKVHCPVLVIYGDKDTSSGPPKPLMAIIRRGLVHAGNKDITEKIFSSADHGLCRTTTGGRKEAGERAKKRAQGAGPDFVPGYLDTMTGWLTQRFERSSL